MPSVLITGAGSGIGLATAKLLDQQGWRVFAGILPDEETSLLLNSAREIKPIQLDITDAAMVHHAAEFIAQETPDDGLNALINNAGIVTVGALETVDLDVFRQQFEVNIFGYMQVTQAMLPLIRQSNNGRIINMISLMGHVGMPLLGAYSMTKHALEAFSDVLRLELAAQGIQVIAIEPGAIRTQMADAMSEKMEQASQQLPQSMSVIYDKLYRAMIAVLQKQTASGTDTEIVAQTIYKALTASNPKPRYAVGADAKGLLMMRKFAPDEISDLILSQALKLPKK